MKKLVLIKLCTFYDTGLGGVNVNILQKEAYVDELG